MFLKIIAGFLTIAFFIACKGNTAATTESKYQIAQKSIAAIEAENPTQFLVVTAKDRKNLIGQTVVKGVLKSTATITKYKDIEVELSFFSKTNTLLEKDIETIYEVVAPNAELHFKTKYYAPKGTANIQLKVLSAKQN
jgi:hypothetical protein